MENVNLEVSTLPMWTLPHCYAGTKWDGWVVFLTRNRDSGLLENCNFDAAMRALAPLREGVPEVDGFSTIEAVRESHWACGWVEWIAIHPSNTKALALAEMFDAKLEDYPVLDEDAFGEAELDAAHNLWRTMSLRERLDLLGKYAPGAPFLVARHDDTPYDADGLYDRLFEQLMARSS